MVCSVHLERFYWPKIPLDQAIYRHELNYRTEPVRTNSDKLEPGMCEKANTQRTAITAHAPRIPSPCHLFRPDFLLTL